MALVDDISRVQELLPNFDTDDTGVLTDCLDAASDIIERYCGRTFAVTAYDELYDGSGYHNLLLNNYPIVSVNKIGINPINVIQFSNPVETNTTSVVRLDATNVYLTTVNASNPDLAFAATLPRAAYTTIQSLADDINANYSQYGWRAEGLGAYALWPVSDLYAPQGGFDCRWGPGYFWLHLITVFSFDQNPDVGEITSFQGFGRGYRNIRVQYTAGFDPIPYPIQQACAELAAATYLARNLNPNLNAESLGEYSYTTIAEKSFKNLSATAVQALALYKSRRVPKYRLYS